MRRGMKRIPFVFVALFLAVAAGTTLAGGLSTRVLEFHVAEYEAAPELIPAHVKGTTQIVYVHSESQFDERDIVNAEVVKQPHTREPAVQLTLKPSGIKKMNALMRTYDHKLMAIVFEGKVIFAPVIVGGPDSGLIDNLLDISGTLSPEEAASMATSVNAAIARELK